MVAHAAAIDSRHNVIVTGSFDGTSGCGSYTAKYAALDGAILWENRDLPRPGAYSYRWSAAVSLDGNDDAWIAGMSETGSYITKLQKTDGVPLWEKRNSDFGGLAISTANQLFLTPNGGAVVTGVNIDACCNYNTAYYRTLYYGAATALDVWREQHFGESRNSGRSADNADPDGDGLPNLLEWACGQDPLQFSISPSKITWSGQELFFDYQRSRAALSAGAVFSVEWSDTLVGVDWHTSDVEHAAVSDNGSVQQVRATCPAGTGMRFVRLRVTNSP